MTTASNHVKQSVGVVFPAGMIGMGFPLDIIEAGVSMGADAVVIDGGSTDSGPHYLGTGTSKSSASAVEADLRVMLVAARRAGIPVVVGSCGTAGTDSGVDWTADLVRKIASELGLTLRLARIYSELSAGFVVEAIKRGRVVPLKPMSALDPDTVLGCAHIVGLMGHEPLADALAAGADVILAGRATDTALVAAIALHHGMPEGPSWHAAKTVECGGVCTTNARAAGSSSPVYVTIDHSGFTVVPLHPAAECTPRSVAGHMLYENADPFSLVEPTGVLRTHAATYAAVDDRTVRVEGSVFELSGSRSMKIEGSRKAGYETMSFVGIADPYILKHLDRWVEVLLGVLHQRVQSLLRLDAGEYEVELRSYGWNGVVGGLVENVAAPLEVGVLFKARAATQENATAVAKIANPLLLHHPLPEMKYVPSFAFATSPAEIERGVAYEFVLNHVIDISEDTTQPFRTEFEMIGGR